MRQRRGANLAAAMCLSAQAVTASEGGRVRGYVRAAGSELLLAVVTEGDKTCLAPCVHWGLCSVLCSAELGMVIGETSLREKRDTWRRPAQKQHGSAAALLPSRAHHHHPTQHTLGIAIGSWGTSTVHTTWGYQRCGPCGTFGAADAGGRAEVGEDAGAAGTAAATVAGCAAAVAPASPGQASPHDGGASNDPAAAIAVSVVPKASAAPANPATQAAPAGPAA